MNIIRFSILFDLISVENSEILIVFLSFFEIMYYCGLAFERNDDTHDLEWQFNQWHKNGL